MANRPKKAASKKAAAAEKPPEAPEPAEVAAPETAAPAPTPEETEDAAYLRVYRALRALAPDIEAKIAALEAANTALAVRVGLIENSVNLQPASDPPQDKGWKPGPKAKK